MSQPRIRRWRKPSVRAKKYVADLKAKVHTAGPKEGQLLSDLERGVRIGFLQNQSDQAGLYKFTKAMKEGKTKEQARAIAATIGKPKN